MEERARLGEREDAGGAVHPRNGETSVRAEGEVVAECQARAGGGLDRAAGDVGVARDGASARQRPALDPGGAGEGAGEFEDAVADEGRAGVFVRRR